MYNRSHDGPTRSEEKHGGNDPDPWAGSVTPEEAADYLNIGRTSFYKLMRSGEIESIKIGRLRRIRKSALDRYLDELAGEAEQA